MDMTIRSSDMAQLMAMMRSFFEESRKEKEERRRKEKEERRKEREEANERLLKEMRKEKEERRKEREEANERLLKEMMNYHNSDMQIVKPRVAEKTDIKEVDTTENNNSKEKELKDIPKTNEVDSNHNDELKDIPTTNEVDSNRNDEWEDILSISNSVEQEAETGPSEHDTARKPRIDDMEVNEGNSSELNDDNGSDQNTNDSELQFTIDSDDAHSVDLAMSGSGSNFQVDHLKLNDSDDVEDGEDDAVNEEVNLVQETLARERPEYQTNRYEIMCCEHELTTRRRHIYSSRLMVEKLRVLHNLRKHQGCVNSMNFNCKGDILCSGSDDLRIFLWDWCNNKMLHSFKSADRLNEFPYDPGIEYTGMAEFEWLRLNEFPYDPGGYFVVRGQEQI